MEGVTTIFFLRPATLCCVHSRVAGLTLLNCWGWANDLWASLPNRPLPFCSMNISTAIATWSTSYWDCWLRLQKCVFLSSESCRSCYFPSTTWKSNAKADLSKGEPRVPSRCCRWHRCCFLCSYSRAHFQVLPWGCIRLQAHHKRLVLCLSFPHADLFHPLCNWSSFIALSMAYSNNTWWGVNTMNCFSPFFIAFQSGYY